jgi:transposase
MEKRGSPYLRKTLYLAARLVAQNVPKFKEYLEKKLSEHKPYKVALSHVAKKLIRLIYRLGISGGPYLA